MLGTSFGPVALAFGVLALPGATPTTLSVVLAANTGTQLIFLLVGGVLADRMSRYRLMVASDTVTALAWAGVAVMMLTGWAPLWLLILAASVAGLAEALFFPALTGVIPEVVPADQLQAANGVLRLGTNTARFLGFAVAGASVAIVGPGWTMVATAATFLLSAGLLVGLRLPGTAPVGRSHVLADLRDGWREFASREWLWVVVLQFSFVVAGLQAFYGVLGPVVAKSDLGGARAWSAVLAGEAVGMLAGVFIAIRIRPRRPILLGVALTLPLALAPLLLGVRAPLWTVVTGAFAAGMCIDIFGVLWETTMQREVPPAALSRVSSYDALGSFMFGPLGLLAAGPLATSVGPRAALVAAAGVIVLPTVAALFSPGVRRMRGPVAVPTTPVEPAPGADTPVQPVLRTDAPGEPVPGADAPVEPALGTAA